MSNSFTAMSVLSQGSATLTDGAAPELVSAMSVSPNFFALLGVTMELGGTFPPEAESPGDDRWVVLSHGFWQNWFGGQPDVIGSTLVLNDQVHTVVGVLPREFRFPESSELWLPQTFEPDQLGEGMRGARYLQVIARLRSGVSIERARTEMAAIAEHLGAIHPNNAGWGVVLIRLRENTVAEYQRSLMLLLLATVLVLAIACANVVNLVLARTSDRIRERAIHVALGASGWRLFRESVVQHVSLSTAGGLGGVLAASFLIPALVQLAPGEIPRVDDVTVDARVLLMSLIISVSVGLALSLVSTWSSVGSDPSVTIRSAQIGETVGRHRVRRLLIATEVGLSLVLLIGAGLLTRSFVNLQHVDPGFSTANITTASLSLPESRYGSDAQRASFFRQLLEQLSSRQEFDAVAATTNLPLSGSAMSFGFSIDGRPEATENEQAAAEYHVITPGYFRTMGIELLRGRALSWNDDSNGAPVALVNQTFADRYWPDENPVGKRITVVSRGGPTSREIVGVVSNVRHAGLASLPTIEVYVPLEQDPWPFATLVVRAPVQVEATRLVRAQLAVLDAGLPLGSVIPVERVVSRWLAPLRFQMTLVGLFAVTSLVLAACGIYGVVSYVVSLRSNEIGVRMALGANTGDVFRSVVGQGMLLAGGGGLLGIVAAFWATRYLSNMLYEVSPTDPFVFFMAVAVVLFVALLGSTLPARRAIKVDPVEALRRA
jgi:predicted permease